MDKGKTNELLDDIIHVRQRGPLPTALPKSRSEEPAAPNRSTTVSLDPRFFSPGQCFRALDLAHLVLFRDARTVTILPQRSRV